MKKFALTAIAAVMFSGVASAKTIEIPEGYRVDSVGNGIISVYKKGDDGKYHEFEYHTAKEDMTIVHADGYQVEIKSAGDNYHTYKEHTDAWNVKNKGDVGAGSDQILVPDNGHTQLPDFGMGDDSGSVERPYPGTGNGSVERPQPGNGAGSVDRPQPGNGVGGVDRPQPGAGEGAVSRPQPGNGVGSIERPQPGQNNRPGNDTSTRPGLVNQVNQNKNNIAAMGEAFEQRVDVVNGYLSQAGQAIQNNSNKVDALAGAFQAQAAHTTQEIARLDGRINSLEEKTEKLKGGIASATAIASLTQYTGNGQHHVAVGIGGYDGAAAMAAGYTYAISADTTIRATFAFDTEGDVAMGASIGHSW